jgi:putative RecB family exonuclease
MAETPKHTSYSAITAFTDCGERYRLEKIEHVPQVGAWWSWGGTAVHSVTEQHDLAAFVGDDEGFEATIPERMAAAIDAAVTERPVADQPPRSAKGQERDWWITEGAVMVQGWIDWLRKTGMTPIEVPVEGSDTWVPAIELKVQATFGGLPLLAFIDRVMIDPQGGIHVIDIKAGSKTPQSLLQLGTYAVLMEEVYGVVVTDGAYFMARKGELTMPKPLNLYTRTYFDRLVGGFKKARDAAAYVANPASDLCGVCGVSYACFAQGGYASHLYAPNATAHN